MHFSLSSKRKDKAISRSRYKWAKDTPTNLLFFRHTMKSDASKLLGTIDYIFDQAQTSF